MNRNDRRHSGVQRMLINLRVHPKVLSAAEGLAIDTETETIYISSWRGCRILVFKGESEEEIPELSNLFIVKYPCGLRFKHRMLYVTESDKLGSHTCIKVFQRNGKLLMTFGPWGTYKVQFIHPLALDVDIDKNMYICNAEGGTIKVFSKGGKLISEFGKGNQLKPTDIRVYKTLIYVLDHKNPRVLVFDYKYNFVTEFAIPQIIKSNYFVINELILSSKCCDNSHYFTHYCTNGRRGIDMDSKERLISAFHAVSGYTLQVIEDM